MSDAAASLSGFVDGAQVRRRFSRSAAQYAQHDFLVREIDARMLERLDYVQIAPSVMLDLGCARGASGVRLRQRYPGATMINLDFSLPMLQCGVERELPVWRRWLGGERRRASPLAAQAEQIPLRSASVGLLWSNLLLHWLDSPLPALREAHRVMEVGGLIMFSTFGPDTLKELRQAFPDHHAHVQRFADMHDLGDMLVECGFADPVMDMEILTVNYPDIDSLLGELRQAGSGCAMRARRRGLTGKGVWQSVRERYEDCRTAGGLPATFEVVYGHAWKAPEKRMADGRSVIHFAPRQRGV